MEIKLYGYEVQDALMQYLEAKYDIDLENKIDEEIPMWIRTRVPQYVYKKHKNGKYVKCEHGARVVDYEKTTYKTEYHEFNEDDEIEICIKN